MSVGTPATPPTSLRIMHQLHILPPLVEEESFRNTIAQVEGFSSPVGWWTVSTEGDVEGRSTRDLGTHYGHVAEIALFLADKSFYSLHFMPIPGKQGLLERPTYRASRARAWVTLGASLLSHLDKKQRVKILQAWLDTDAVEAIPPSYNYSFTGIQLKPVSSAA